MYFSVEGVEVHTPLAKVPGQNKDILALAGDDDYTPPTAPAIPEEDIEEVEKVISEEKMRVSAQPLALANAPTLSGVVEATPDKAGSQGAHEEEEEDGQVSFGLVNMTPSRDKMGTDDPMGLHSFTGRETMASDAVGLNSDAALQ